MSTTPKPCTVKGCTEKLTHHHKRENGESFTCLNTACSYRSVNTTRLVSAHRPTRKMMQAEIDRLTTENEQLIERGWEDEKALAKPSETLDTLTIAALSTALRRGDSEAAMRFTNVLSELGASALLSREV